MSIVSFSPHAYSPAPRPETLPTAVRLRSLRRGFGGRAILDDIAWPRRARPETSQGVAFFNRFRDLVASGFWSSEMGIRDLQYIGNTAVPVWNGCPPEAVRKLGL